MYAYAGNITSKMMLGTSKTLGKNDSFVQIPTMFVLLDLVTKIEYLKNLTLNYCSHKYQLGEEETAG